VFVVDDDASVRRAVARLLRAAGYAVETFEKAEDLLAAAPFEGAACAVLDVRLPGMNGLELQQALAARSASLPIVFITGHGDVPLSVRAMKSGAVDFLSKPFEDEDFLAAIEQALAKNSQARAVEAEHSEIAARVAQLSKRERAVMDLVVRGLLNKQVAKELGIAEKTVKVHRAGVMRKMKAESFADLVRMTQRLAETAIQDQGPIAKQR
jgi:FixJ family two-component response regulator